MVQVMMSKVWHDDDEDAVDIEGQKVISEVTSFGLISDKESKISKKVDILGFTMTPGTSDWEKEMLNDTNMHDIYKEVKQIGQIFDSSKPSTNNLNNKIDSSNPTKRIS